LADGLPVTIAARKGGLPLVIGLSRTDNDRPFMAACCPTRWSGRVSATLERARVALIPDIRAAP